ncbi:MAG: 4a-hydroxytetrahydrobiopterin dehydratase [Acidobacteria bacterium]|nr:4a-hydroxytetrahydrobiopterin dehydratase [Acidobacteriota bacterium]
MERKKLSDAEVNERLSELKDWKFVEGRLRKRTEFENFAESLAFVNKVGSIAEAADHHPDITFGWGYAELELMTHDREGITDVDFAVAAKIDELDK